MDVVDAAIQQWQQVLPDEDPQPMNVIARLLRLALVLSREHRAFLAEEGLQPWEFDMLSTLRRADSEAGLTPDTLVKTMMVTSGAMTHRVDRLVERGLAERVPHHQDRRTYVVRLTACGQQLADAVMPRHFANQRRLLSGVSEEEQQRLVELLRVVQESADSSATT